MFSFIVLIVSSGKGFKVRLHPYPEEGVFRLNRFHLDKNNVRQWWYRQEEKQTAHSRGIVVLIYTSS